MKSKKNSYITFRCSQEVKVLLEELSNEKEWTLSHTVEKIISEYCMRKEEGRKIINSTKYDFLLRHRTHSDLRTMCVDLMRPLSLQTVLTGVYRKSL